MNISSLPDQHHLLEYSKPLRTGTQREEMYLQITTIDSSDLGICGRRIGWEEE